MKRTVVLLALVACAEPVAPPARIDTRVIALAGKSAPDEELLVQLVVDDAQSFDAGPHARVRTRGITKIDAYVRADRLDVLAATLPSGAELTLPRTPWPALGPHTSQGRALLEAEAFEAAGFDGTGVDIAVLDTSFAGWTRSAQNGELASATPPAREDGNGHGTACAEIVADVAPGARLHPVIVESDADIEAFVLSLDTSPIKVVSHSLVWSGGPGWGDGTGPFCALIDRSLMHGVQWVTSAGNDGNGRFYLGTFTDEDHDGKHDFAPDDPYNAFTIDGSALRVSLDWNAYPKTSIDYDLHLHRHDGASWTEIMSSARVQDGTIEPWEQIDALGLAPGEYAVSVSSSSTVARALRIVVHGGGAPQLSHQQAESSLLDPAHCAGAITVGAMKEDEYEAHLIWSESSRGPTLDGRTKPDVVAPSHVETSIFGRFEGTSAAAPHVAAAIALYMQALGEDAPAAAAMVLDDALPEGTGRPNNTFGFGRVVLRVPSPQQMDAGVVEDASAGDASVAADASFLPFDVDPDEESGCACSSQRSGASPWLMLLLVAYMCRRRDRACTREIGVAPATNSICTSRSRCSASSSLPKIN